MVSLNSSIRVALGVLLLAYSFPYLQNRIHSLSVLLHNHPDTLPELNRLSNPSVKFPNRIRNCEDVLISDEDGVAILACDPGRDRWNTVMGTFHPDPSDIPNGALWVYRYSSESDRETILTPIQLADYPENRNSNFSFHPLGIDYHHPSRTLFVVNHHVDGSRVDVFSLDLSASPPLARHAATVLHPLTRTPNAVVALSSHEFYVSNDHALLRREHPWLYQVETYAAYPGGSIAYVNLATSPPEIRTVARVPFANGVAVLQNSNGSVLAVASTSSGQVRLYEILPDRSLKYTDVVDVNLMPDNLSVDGDGVLLIAGHPHPPSLEGMVHRRRICTAERGIEAEECWKADAPSAVVQWTKEKGVEELYVSRGEFGTGCSAARDVKRGVGLVGGLYENGILVWSTV